MEKDTLILSIKTSQGEGALGKAFKKSTLLVEKKAELLKPKKLKSEEDDEWLIDALKWINYKCSHNIELINVTSSNWYYTIGSFQKEVSRRFPLDTKLVGGYVWVEKLAFDKWIVDIQIVGKYVSVLSVSKGSTDDFYPKLIFRYALLCNDTLM